MNPHLTAKDIATGVVIYKTFCLDVTQGRKNVAPNETWTYSERFACQAC